jgi:hypothetical protein
MSPSYLNRKDVVRGNTTVLHDRLDRNNVYDPRVCRRDLRQVKYFTSDRRIDIVRILDVRMTGQLAYAEDVLRWTNDVAQDGNDKDSASTNKPNDHVQGELLPPRLSNVHPFHAPDVSKEKRRHPPSQCPAECHPTSTGRSLLEHLTGLAFQNLTGERLFVNEPRFVVGLEHVSGWSIRLSAKIGRGIVVTGVSTRTVVLVTPKGFSLVVLIIVQVRTLEG